MQKIEDDGPIEFGASKMMEEMVSEDQETPKIVELKDGELPKLSESTKPEFSPQSAVNALTDSDDEGGVSKERSSSASYISAETLQESGGRVKQPNMEAPSVEDKFEVTGFTVEMETSPGNITSIRIRDYFDTLDEVMASIEGSRYLMPVKPKGFKVTKITLGAPIVCRNERQLYEYVQGKWRKT